MALFRGTVLYHRNTDQDQSWGTIVKALLGTAAAGTDWTQTFTSTTAHFQTTQPFTNTTSSASNDTRTNHGWAINEAESSTDGMGSTATRKRYVPAGNWQFSTALSWSAPALLASYSIYIEYSVYRVATGGGARTLLFSVNSNTQNVTLVAGSGTLTASSSQSIITIEPGETIHVAMRINSAATSSILGGTTNSVITVKGVTSGAISTTLPSPGLRNLNIEASDGVAEGAGTRELMAQRTMDSVGEGDSTIARLVDFFRVHDAAGEGYGTLGLGVGKTMEAVGEGDSTIARLVDFYRTADSVGEGEGDYSLMVQKTMESIVEGDGTMSRLVDFFRAADAIAEGQGERALLVVMKDMDAIADCEGTRSISITKDAINAIAEGDGSRELLITKDAINAIAEGEGDITKTVIFVRDFDAAGEADGDITKVVIFVRDFDAVAEGELRARIELDFDELPEPTGGVTIKVGYSRGRVTNA